MAFTQRQKTEIEYLINRGKAIHRKQEEATADFDKERLQNDLDYVKGELHDALNAEAMYRAHLRVAKEHIAEAERIYAKWCKA